jgi:hypothetical protein
LDTPDNRTRPSGAAVPACTDGFSPRVLPPGVPFSGSSSPEWRAPRSLGPGHRLMGLVHSGPSRSGAGPGGGRRFARPASDWADRNQVTAISGMSARRGSGPDRPAAGVIEECPRCGPFARTGPRPRGPAGGVTGSGRSGSSAGPIGTERRPVNPESIGRNRCVDMDCTTRSPRGQGRMGHHHGLAPSLNA